MPIPKVGDVLSAGGQDYQITAQLGRGGQGVAFKVRSGEKEYFLKYMEEPTPFMDEQDGFLFKRRQLRLKELLPSIPHFVPDIIDFFVFGHRYCRLERLVAGVDLLEVLREAADDPMAYDLPTRIRHAMILAHTVSMVHGVGLVHSDIKPENVIVEARGDERERLVLIDFDTGFESGQCDGFFGLTPGYAAPEQQGREAFDLVDQPADIFALGCLLYEVLLGGTPWIHEVWASAAPGGRFIRAKEAAEAAGVDYPPFVLDLLEKMLSPEQSQRPTAAEVHSGLLFALGSPELPPQPEILILTALGDLAFGRLEVQRGDPLILGRDMLAGLPGAETVSMRHLRVGWDTDRWYCWHMSRSNPTVIRRDGKEIVLDLLGSKAELGPGDTVELGSLVLGIEPSQG